MRPPKAVLSWSTGKDCAFALIEAHRQGLADVVALLSTTNEAFDRVAMQGTRTALLRAQVEALGLPLIEVPLPWPCSNNDYEARMETALTRVAATGASQMIFGDLFLEDVRAHREAKLAGSGIAPLFPLWGRPTSALAREMIAAGIDARIVTVDPTKLSPCFAGRRYDEDLLVELPDGIDPCGENGEFHTAVLGHPMFAAPIAAQPGETVTRDGFVYADLIPA